MTERERRAYNRGIEAAAAIADLWADECLRMSDHTIRADPLLALIKVGRGTGAEIDAAHARSQMLISEGSFHCARHHAAKGIAAMTRNQKIAKKKPPQGFPCEG